MIAAAIPISTAMRSDKKPEQPEPVRASHLQILPVEVPPPDRAAKIDWFDLVCRIQRNDPASLEELYALMARGIKILIIRHLGRQDVDDRVHDAFLLVVQAIQRGDLREPDRLLAFTRTVVRRRISHHLDHATARRDTLTGDATNWLQGREASPEEAAIRGQNADIMESVMRTLSRRDREILTRFYYLEQTPDQICAEMDLTDNQFRLLKSRAKTRFTDEGRRRTARDKIRQLFVRETSA